MSFQKTVSKKQGFGVVGGIYADSPTRAQSFIVFSPDPTNNVFGRAFSIYTEGKVTAGGVGVFAGFLINPKLNESIGTVNGGPLASTLALKNETVAEFLTMGLIIVSLPASANIGDFVYFDTTTGELTTQAPNFVPLLGTRFAHAVVDYFTVSSPGLAVIRVTDVPTNV